ncbi:MAG: hypothetical protein AAF310_05200 [Myxococcota bacterium]
MCNNAQLLEQNERLRQACEPFIEVDPEVAAQQAAERLKQRAFGKVNALLQRQSVGLVPGGFANDAQLTTYAGLYNQFPDLREDIVQRQMLEVVTQALNLWLNNNYQGVVDLQIPGAGRPVANRQEPRREQPRGNPMLQRQQEQREQQEGRVLNQMQPANQVYVRQGFWQMGFVQDNELVGNQLDGQPNNVLRQRVTQYLHGVLDQIQQSNGYLILKKIVDDNERISWQDLVTMGRQCQQEACPPALFAALVRAGGQVEQDGGQAVQMDIGQPARQVDAYGYFSNNDTNWNSVTKQMQKAEYLQALFGAGIANLGANEGSYAQYSKQMGAVRTLLEGMQPQQLMRDMFAENFAGIQENVAGPQQANVCKEAMVNMQLRKMEDAMKQTAACVYFDTAGKSDFFASLFDAMDTKGMDNTWAAKLFEDGQNWLVGQHGRIEVLQESFWDKYNTARNRLQRQRNEDAQNRQADLLQQIRDRGANGGDNQQDNQNPAELGIDRNAFNQQLRQAVLAVCGGGGNGLVARIAGNNWDDAARVMPQCLDMLQNSAASNPFYRQKIEELQQ